MKTTATITVACLVTIAMLKTVSSSILQSRAARAVIAESVALYCHPAEERKGEAFARSRWFFLSCAWIRILSSRDRSGLRSSGLGWKVIVYVRRDCHCKARSCKARWALWMLPLQRVPS